MKDLKNTITTICAIVIAVCGAVIPVLVSSTWHPEWLMITLGVLAAIATALIGVFSGRNADGSRKSVAQIEKQQEMKDTPPAGGTL